MDENLTRKLELVREIPSKYRESANPAGRQGYEVIILEKVGDSGTRYYCSLKPGETLRLSERVFGKFIVLEVDLRHARSFRIGGQFAVRERGCPVTLQANVRYRVTDARIVALETVDPLGELRDKVISTINRELAQYQESDINPGLIERIIRTIGMVSHLGLMVEDAEVIEFEILPRKESKIMNRPQQQPGFDIPRMLVSTLVVVVLFVITVAVLVWAAQQVPPVTLVFIFLIAVVFHLVAIVTVLVMNGGLRQKWAMDFYNSVLVRLFPILKSSIERTKKEVQD
jgi:heme/copper-type cytochrome/quinol oxidase subunit 4